MKSITDCKAVSNSHALNKINKSISVSFDVILPKNFTPLFALTRQLIAIPVNPGVFKYVLRGQISTKHLPWVAVFLPNRAVA
jgi:hypothetical protein